jgi:hypothetical protein
LRKYPAVTVSSWTGVPPASGTAVSASTLFGSGANPATCSTREVDAKGVVTEGAVMRLGGMDARVGYGAPTRGERRFRPHLARESAVRGALLIASSAHLRVKYARKRAELVITMWVTTRGRRVVMIAEIVHTSARGQWDRARLGAQTWIGHGVLAHNLVKISTAPQDRPLNGDQHPLPGRPSGLIRGFDFRVRVSDH